MTGPTPIDEALAAVRAGPGQPAGAGDWPRSPMNPRAVRPEPAEPVPGFPFLPPGNAAVIVGPTGGGRSSLVQACAYDAALGGANVAYLGSEVTQWEFDARAADLAGRRSDTIDDDLEAACARVHYLDLADTLSRAWRGQSAWVEFAAGSYDVVIADPLAAAASVLDLDFDTSNADYSRFYDRLVQPLVAKRVSVVLLDNIGHAEAARTRAKGASAKSDRADLALHTKPHTRGLVLTADKVRSVTAGYERGAAWLFTRDDRRIEPHDTAAERGPSGEFRPTVLMERASRAIEAEPGLTKRALRGAVSGRDGYIDKAIDRLVEEGYVRVEHVDKSSRHFHVGPYREADDLAAGGAA